jgi:hypothetical protein
MLSPGRSTRSARSPRKERDSSEHTHVSRGTQEHSDERSRDNQSSYQSEIDKLGVNADDVIAGYKCEPYNSGYSDEMILFRLGKELHNLNHFLIEKTKFIDEMREKGRGGCLYRAASAVLGSIKRSAPSLGDTAKEKMEGGRKSKKSRKSRKSRKHRKHRKHNKSRKY